MTDTLEYPVKYRRLYKYETEEDVEYELPVRFPYTLKEAGGWATLEGNILKVKARASYDGPSGPTFDTENSMGPALAHDFLYKVHQDNGVLTFKNRRRCDLCFAKMLQMNQMRGWRFRIWYLAVRMFGGLWA